MTDWISVKDRLPVKGDTVRWKGIRWRHQRDTTFNDLEAEFLGMNEFTGCPMVEIDQDTHWNESTHWQPLPEPPKTEEK